MGMKVKQGKSVIRLLFLKINVSTSISMKRSCRELSIDVVIHWIIFKNNSAPPVLPIPIPKTGI